MRNRECDWWCVVGRESQAAAARTAHLFALSSLPHLRLAPPFPIENVLDAVDRLTISGYSFTLPSHHSIEAFLANGGPAGRHRDQGLKPLHAVTVSTFNIARD